MFGSLRSKLVLSHFIVILVAFILTAAIASVPIRRTQEARLRNSLVLSSESVARQLDLSRTLAPASDLADDVNQIEFAQRLVDSEQRRSGNRILVLSEDGIVVLDSGSTDSFVNQSEPLLASAIDQLARQIGTNPTPRRVVARVALVLDTYSIPAGELDDKQAVVAATAATGAPDRTNRYVAAIAPRGAAPLVDEFVRPLALASGVALIAALAIGLVISRSVTGPLERLTSDVGEISAGDLDKRMEYGAAGEVGTLVDAFNQMLDRIASTYRSQRELLANIAHELRTPLTSIQGYAQALRDNVIKDQDARDQALDTIADEARRMTELVEQILQLSRLESGQLPIHFAPTSIGEVLERVDRQFAPIADERGIRLVIGRDAEIQAVIDEDLIARALGNLTANAIRHTDAGGAVEVRASRVSTPGKPAGIRLTIRDSGAGIGDEQLERIFERFYRVGDRSAQHDSRNFGLGLAIVHEIVSRHGGEMSVASTPAQGTTFTIDLPSLQENGSRDQRT